MRAQLRRFLEIVARRVQRGIPRHSHAVRYLVCTALLALLPSLIAAEQARPGRRPRAGEPRLLRRTMEAHGYQGAGAVRDQIERILPSGPAQLNRPPLGFDVVAQRIAASSPGANVLTPAMSAERARVRSIQVSLNEALGTNLQVDGVLGEQTRNAIREFQRKNALPSTGEIDAWSQQLLFQQAGTHVGTNADGIHVRTTATTTSVLVWSESHVYGTASSAEQLIPLLGDRKTLVQEGSDLPLDWQQALSDRRIIRVGGTSPKPRIADHAAAARLVDRRASDGATRVFSALPGNGSGSMEDQLRAMSLRTEAASGWQDLHGEMTRLGQEVQASGHSIEVATREAVLNEWFTGHSTNLVLIAHFDQTAGRLHLPNGETIHVSDLERRRREPATDRVIILISCNTGEMSGSLLSPAEKLIEVGAATLVVAPTEQVSALSVPGLLHRFLLEGGTVQETFDQASYQRISSRIPTGAAGGLGVVWLLPRGEPFGR